MLLIYLLARGWVRSSCLKNESRGKIPENHSNPCKTCHDVTSLSIFHYVGVRVRVRVKVRVRVRFVSSEFWVGVKIGGDYDSKARDPCCFE